MSTPGDSPRPDLARLTAMRGIACLLVFLFHVGMYAPSSITATFKGLYPSVVTFFVISGFVLTWVHSVSLDTKRYLVKRAARIYPTHLTVLALCVLIVGGSSLKQLVATGLLVQAWFPSEHIAFGANGPAWSLSCEVFFYLAFPLLLKAMTPLSTRRLLTAVGVWWFITTAVTAALALHGGEAAILAYPNPVLRSSDFALGMGCALLIRRGWSPPRPLATSILSLVLVATTTAWPPPYPLANAVFALPSVLLVGSLAAADLRSSTRRMAWPWVKLGVISYSFYLVHEAVLRTSVRHGHSAFEALLASVALAILLYRTLEVGSRRLVAPRSQAPDTNLEALLPTQTQPSPRAGGGEAPCHQSVHVPAIPTQEPSPATTGGPVRRRSRGAGREIPRR